MSTSMSVHVSVHVPMHVFAKECHSTESAHVRTYAYKNVMSAHRPIRMSTHMLPPVPTAEPTPWPTLSSQPTAAPLLLDATAAQQLQLQAVECHGTAILRATTVARSIWDGPGRYMPNLFCQWTITAHELNVVGAIVATQPITLDFSAFQTEAGFDFLKVVPWTCVWTCGMGMRMDMGIHMYTHACRLIDCLSLQLSERCVLGSIQRVSIDVLP